MHADLAVPALAGRPPTGSALLSTLRRTQYARLDATGHAYLDYTGAALYGSGQIEAHHETLLRDVLGNPHSENPTSAVSTDRMDCARARVLEFFHADRASYDVVFTTNASAALRLVGESFPFQPGSRFVLTADNHNSVNGIRCYAERAGADVRRVPLRGDLRSTDPLPWLDGARADRRHLFAYPAQSNFSGVRHPVDWIDDARDRGYHIVLDAAAFAPTAPLDIGALEPDFVCLSFYKMFGFPTGIGALIARREALAVLRRPWFAGGTVDWVSTQYAGHALRSGSAAFEDGTPHFLAFDAVIDGLDLLDNIAMPCIAEHTQAMTALMLDRMVALRHPGGEPLVAIHGPLDLEQRGATVAFNVLGAGGEVVPFERVVAAAARHRVSVRGGCF